MNRLTVLLHVVAKVIDLAAHALGYAVLAGGCIGVVLGVLAAVRERAAKRARQAADVRLARQRELPATLLARRAERAAELQAYVTKADFLHWEVSLPVELQDAAVRPESGCE